MSEWLTVIAPASVRTWYDQFRGTAGGGVFLGEDDLDLVRVAGELEREASGRGIRLLSGHDSLLRDWLIARELDGRGVRVESQSGFAVAAGRDKVLQREILQGCGVPIPHWWVEPSGTARDRGQGLVKDRHGTQSRGLNWASEAGVPSPGESYWEEFVHGIEYSVVMYAGRRGLVMFPPVWKGSVQEDLRPPWQRLRLVPSGLSDELERELYESSRRVAQMIDLWGFCEMEFIAPPDASPVLIDVNPRVCGTMRIVAMATETPIFDLDALDSAGNMMLEARRFAGEIPYEGPPFSRDGVVATTRLTCAAKGSRVVAEELAARGFDLDNRDLPEPWRAN